MSTQTHHLRDRLILASPGLLMAVCFALIAPKSAWAEHTLSLKVHMAECIENKKCSRRSFCNDYLHYGDYFHYIIEDDGECTAYAKNRHTPNHKVHMTECIDSENSSRYFHYIIEDDGECTAYAKRPQDHHSDYLVHPKTTCIENEDSSHFCPHFFIDKDGECIEYYRLAHFEIGARAGYLGYFASGNKTHGLNTTISISIGSVMFSHSVAHGGFTMFLEQNLGGGLKGYDGFIGSTLFSMGGFIPIIYHRFLLNVYYGMGAAYSVGKTAFGLDEGAFALKFGLGMTVPVTNWLAIGADFSYTFLAGKDYIGHIIAPSLTFRFDPSPPRFNPRSYRDP
ncbi:MAG: hypothetical protein FWC40_00270 [Proteobacteria bacterium]|nr:hypothetical protein [Pseudomonadota bacterium]